VYAGAEGADEALAPDEAGAGEPAGVAAPTDPLVELTVAVEWPGSAWLRYTPATATAATDAKAAPLEIDRARSMPASRWSRAARVGSIRGVLPARRGALMGERLRIQPDTQMKRF
jgi:hypothetical protein